MPQQRDVASYCTNDLLKVLRATDQIHGAQLHGDQLLSCYYHTILSAYVALESYFMIEDFIPAGIRQTILGSKLASGTLATARTLHDHYKLSGVPFFREYTDHSFQHSIDVFKSACDIASEAAFEIISADDLNVLLLASIFHDAGLHITEDVFLALTDPSNSRIAVPEFDQKTWPELWIDFLAEAQRFNAKKLVQLFGDENPVREPPRSSMEMSQRDRLLIGDFLRRHHPRFGHEFALGGVPDASGKTFQFLEIEAKTRDIVGLVARSHGLGLRDTFEYVQKHYDLRDYNRIHIVYLMVLIRIADSRAKTYRAKTQNCQRQ